MRLFAVAAALFVLLLTLAALQYRWLGDVSAAERERMRAGLQARAADVAQAVDGELTRTFVAFHVDVDRLDADPAAALADAYARWQASAQNAALVRAVYFVDPKQHDVLRRLDPSARALTAIEWPAELRSWMARLPFADVIEASIPAVIVSLPNVPRAAGGRGFTVVADPSLVVRTIIVQLDPAVLRDRLLAPAVGRYFGSAADSIVTVVSRDDPSRVVFASDAETRLDRQSADVSVSLFDLRIDDLNRIAPPSHAPDGRGKLAFTIVRRANGSDERRLFTSTGIDTGAWTLFARYRADSLDAIVAASRRRNFAIVLAVLLLLGGSTALMLVSAHRERRMARQQMQFVAAVSHELRTPLAVIRSAGENLADGLVTDGDQVKRYGAVVQNEGRRLSDMVERVMQFAGLASGPRTRAKASVDVAAVVRDAVEAVRSEGDERRVAVAVHANGPLPAIAGDADALRSAVQNVVANALKYSASGGVVDVAAAARDHRVEVRVRDEGIGIDADDLPHVFEPFYRGRRAVDAQVRGSGIGLSVVDTIVKEHGGSVRIESRPGDGTTVTIDLPVPA